MSTVYLPTPWQYFLDVISDARIREVEAKGVPADIKLIHAQYDNLKETEVTFSKPVFKPQPNIRDSYYVINFDCIGRGYSRRNLPYKTWPLKGMVHKAAQIPAGPFSELTKEGFYFDPVTEQYHLLAQEGSNYWVALKATGYDFSPEFYDQVIYGQFNPKTGANGHIDVKYSFLAGRIYITWITKKVESPKIEEQALTKEEPKQELVQEGPADVPNEDPKVDATEGQDVAEKVQEEAPVEKQAEQPVVKQFSKKR